MIACTPLTDQLLDFRDFLQCSETFEILTDTHRPRHWPDERCGLYRGKESRPCSRFDAGIWVVDSVREYRQQRAEWTRCAHGSFWRFTIANRVTEYRSAEWFDDEMKGRLR